MKKQGAKEVAKKKELFCRKFFSKEMKHASIIGLLTFMLGLAGATFYMEIGHDNSFIRRIVYGISGLFIHQGRPDDIDIDFLFINLTLIPAIVFFIISILCIISLLSLYYPMKKIKKVIKYIIPVCFLVSSIIVILDTIVNYYSIHVNNGYIANIIVFVLMFSGLIGVTYYCIKKINIDL